MDPQANNTTSISSKPVLPWRTRLSISIASRVTDATRRANGTVNRRLLDFFKQRAPPSPTPINGVTSTDVTVDPSRNLWFRLYAPSPSPSAAPLPVIIFFHGGGFAFLSPDTKVYDAVCRRFARKIQAVVVSVEYRLAPEHKYPAQYEDGFDVLKFLDQGNAEGVLPENADLGSCFLAGDSAGGNLSHHVAKRACQFQFNKLKVIGVVAIQPFFGGEEITEAEKRLTGIDPLVSLERTEWMWKAFMPPQEGDRDHEVINVSGPRAADISKLDFPAVLVVVGGFDSLQDWQRRYYHWLKKSGKKAHLVEFPTMVHAFYIFPELPESAQLIAEMKEFMLNQLSKI